jgi:hypothetical protein
LIFKATGQRRLRASVRQLISSVPGNAVGMSASPSLSAKSTLSPLNGFGSPPFDDDEDDFAYPDAAEQSYDESLQQILHHSRESTVEPEDPQKDSFVYGGKDAAFADDAEDEDEGNYDTTLASVLGPDGAMQDEEEEEEPRTPNGRLDTHSPLQVSSE